MKVFPGESVKPDGRTSVIKTHGKNGGYQKAIIIVRDYKSVVLSHFALKVTMNHTGQLDDGNLEGSHLLNLLTGLRRKYRDFHVQWLVKFKGPTLVLRYNDMVSDLYPQLMRIRDFLGAEASDEDLKCVLCFNEGEFHRKRATNFDPWKNIPKIHLQETNEETKYVENLLKTTSRENLYV